LGETRDDAQPARELDDAEAVRKRAAVAGRPALHDGVEKKARVGTDGNLFHRGGPAVRTPRRCGKVPSRTIGTRAGQKTWTVDGLVEQPRRDRTTRGHARGPYETARRCVKHATKVARGRRRAKISGRSIFRRARAVCYERNER